MITARSQSLEIRNQLFLTTADMGIFSRKLKLLLNTTSLPVPVENSLQRITFSVLNDSLPVLHNPALNFIQQQVVISKIEKQLERSLMLPDFNLGYSSQTIIGSQNIGTVSRDFGHDYRFSGFQAGISIPIWIAPYKARTKNAKINETIALTDAESLAKTVIGNYSSLLDEFSKYSSSVEYYEKQAVPEAEMIIDQATRSYKAGALDYLDYVSTLNRALAIKQSYLDALNNYNQTIISIENITGKIF
jgi:cobalt-zinc-cadmium resistance protein CzcA